MSRIDDIAATLFGGRRVEEAAIEASSQTYTITGTASTASEDGSVWVRLSDDVTRDESVGVPEAVSGTALQLPTTVHVASGDEVIVTVYGGTISSMVVTGIVGRGDEVDGRIGAIEASYVKTDVLEANYAHITDGVIDNATIGHADVDGLSANYATIANLDAAKVRIGDVEADTAKIHDLTAEQLSAATAYIASLNADDITAASLAADVAKVHDLTAQQLSAAAAYIAALVAGSVTAQSIIADHGDFATVKANAAKVANLTAAELEADHATIGTLDTNYMRANMSNTTVGWIENGTIKEGAISNAMIGNLQANKITGGTLDASKVTVTNLQAKSIQVEKINGVPVSGKSVADALTQHETDLSDFENDVDDRFDAMQAEIDGAIETWTGTAVPTLNNAPANGWTTDKIKDTHVGDVYFVVNSQSQQNGYNYRFSKSTSGGQATYSWQLIKDSDVTAALQRLTTAEGKIGTIEQFDSDISAWKTDTDEELSSMKTAHNTLAGRVTTAEGTLATKVDTTTFNNVKQTVDENSSSITQLTTTTTELRADLDGIEIGGRNLLLATAGGATTAGSTSQSVYTKAWALSDYGLSAMDNTDDIFTWSFDYEVTGNEATGAFIYARIKGSAIVTPDIHGVSRNKYVHDNPTGHYSCSVHLTSTQVSSTTQSCRIRLQSATDGAVLKVWNVKVEKGTKGSDWTAAPEDLESTVTTVSNKVSEHTQTINGFTTRIGALETTIETKADGSTVETVSNKLNTVSDTVDGHTQTISSVQDTLATKADNSTVSTLTTKVNTVSDTVDGHTSQLGRIQTRVENSDPNMLLDWNAPSLTKVDAKVGRYFSHTSDEVTATHFAVADPPMVGIENGVRFVCDGTNTAVKNRGIAFYNEVADTALAFVDGQTYTASWWARCTDGDGLTYFQAVNGGTSSTKASEQYALTSEWQRFTVTFKPVRNTTYGSRVWFCGRFAANTSGTVELCGFKCVPGESAESVATTVTTLSNDYAEYKQTTEEFKTTVGETYATKVELADQVSVRFKLIRDQWTDSQWSTYEEAGYSTTYANKHSTGGGTVFDATKLKVGDYILIEGVSTDSKSPHSVTARITSVPPYASNGFPATTVASVNSTQLASRVSTAETAIDQNKDAIALRATKTEAYQVAQPNLTPYFSMPMTLTSDDYWLSITVARFTQLEDGWAHFECGNTGSSTINNYINPRVIDTLTPGGKYTLLAEFRNVSVIGSTSGNFYSQQSVQSQIWGAGDATGGFTISNYALSNLEGGAGVFYKSLTTLDAESKDPSGTVRGTLPKVSFMSINQQVVAGQSISYDVRLSLYEGEYTGPYKPYTGEKLYATNSELKVTADGISTEVSKKVGASEIISKINQSAETVKIQASRVEIDGTAIFNNTDFKQAADAAYDSKGAASTAESNAKGYADAIEVGGRNILTGTGDFSGARIVSTSITISNGVATFPTQSTVTWLCFMFATIPVSDFLNRTWTVSFDYRSDDFSGATNDAYVYVNFEGSASVNGARTRYRKVSDNSDVPTTKWQRGSYTFEVGNLSWFTHGSGDVNYCGVAFYSHTNKSFQIRHVKLEHGNRATDWTPAPEDVADDISSVETNAKEYADSIEVGGRNLFKLSDTLPSTCWVCVAGTVTDGVVSLTKGSSGDIRFYQTPVNGGYWSWEPNKPYVASVEARIVSGDGKLGINPVGASVSMKQIELTTEWKRYEYAFVSSASIVETGSVSFYNVGATGSVIECRYPKFERGNRATDWSPAPEDVAADISASVVGQGGFTILWNYSNFTTLNNGEAYVCALDPLTNKTSDADGWAMWNGVKRTIPHAMINPNAVVPFRIPIYVVCRLSSEDPTTGTLYLVWYNDGWKYSVRNPSAVSGDFTWVDSTDMVLGCFVMTSAEAAISETVVFRTPWSSKQVTTSTVTANSAQNLANTANNTANAAAPKANAVARSQRIYYRSSSSTKPTAMPTAWVTETGNKYATNATTAANWSTKVTPIANGTGANVTKYLYLWTCEQREMGDGDLEYTNVLLDDSSTVIDGGTVITGSLSANTIDAASGTFDTANIPALTADHIKANVIDAVNANNTGTINADRINASGITIGQSQVTNLTTDLAGKASTSALTAEANQRKAAYGTSSTEAATAAKVVDCSNFALYDGATITVKFSTANTANAPTLNVNSTGDVPVWNNNAVAASTNPVRWGTSATITFVYDGDHWVVQNKPSTYAASCSTAAATRSKSASVTGALVVNGTTVTIDFTTGNTYTSETNSLQLNFAGTGSGNIYYKNAATTGANTLFWSANTSMTFVRRGGNWYLADSGLRKYITHVDDSGITIHPQLGTSNKVVINSDGMEVYKDNGSVAMYGDTARIGRLGGPRIIVGSSSLEMYGNSDGTVPLLNLYANSGLGTIETDNVVFHNLIEGGVGGVISSQAYSFGGYNYTTHTINAINFGYSSATTNSNGVTTFNPDLGVEPTVVFVAPGKASNETEAVAKIAVPMVWSIDSATQVQVRWQRSDTNAWLVNNAVGWYWLAIYRGPNFT